MAMTMRSEDADKDGIMKRRMTYSVRNASVDMVSRSAEILTGRTTDNERADPL